MRELILRDFFLGRVDAGALSRDLDASIVDRGPNEAGVLIEDLEGGEHKVVVADLLKVCDAAVAGHLAPWKLEAVGFCLVASDYFQYDRDEPEGEVITTVIHLWASPQVNYPLTVKNVSRARHLLLTGENTFTEADLEDVPDRAWNVGRVSKIFSRDLE